MSAGRRYNAVMSGFSSIQSAADALARGEVIIVVDAEDRENEEDGKRDEGVAPGAPERARQLA